MCKSKFEMQCRISVLNTLANGIPVRKLMHKYMGEPTNIYYAFDKKLDDCSNGRCDIVVLLEYENREEFIHIECKSRMMDLKSGYGMNFLGDINYIMYPKTPQRFVKNKSGALNRNNIEQYLSEKGIYGIGILELDDNDKIRFVKRPYIKGETLGHLGLGTEFGDY